MRLDHVSNEFLCNHTRFYSLLQFLLRSGDREEGYTMDKREEQMRKGEEKRKEE